MDIGAFTITTISDAVNHNRMDFWHNNRGDNKWQIIACGSAEYCNNLMEIFLESTRFNYYFIKQDYKLSAVVRPGEKIPEVEGIYFLFDDEELIYIGQSKNIHQRLTSAHPIYNRSLLVGIWTTSDDEERLATEKWLIEQYEPPMNKQYLEGVC